MDVSYREAYRMTRVEARRRMVETFTATRSVSHTARRWHTSRSVVRKWVRRYREGELAALWREEHPDARKITAKVSEISALKARLELADANHKLAIHGLLTREQRRAMHPGMGRGMMGDSMMRGGMVRGGMVRGGMMGGCPMMGSTSGSAGH